MRKIIGALGAVFLLCFAFSGLVQAAQVPIELSSDRFVKQQQSVDSGVAQKQLLAQMNLLTGAGGKFKAAPGYQGPGDVVSGATYYWGLRAYNATYAAATGNIADLVASTGGASVCILKAATDGSADIVGTYCAGTTVPLACAAASGGACRVSRLYDQIGTTHLTQSTNSNRPPIVFGCTGGRPCLRCVAGSAHSLQVTLGASISQPYTFSIVSHRQADTTTFGAVAGTVSTNGFFGYNNAVNSIVGNAGTSQTATASDAAFHSIAIAFDGASSDMNVDGTPNAKNLGTQAVGTSFGLCVVPGNAFGTAEVGELAVYSTAFSGTQSSNMSTNQHSFWGF